jgi:hypothetical protein
MRLIFCALMALAAVPQVEAAITFHASSSVKDLTTQMDVTLADSYIAVDTARGRMVYDFQTRRRYAVNTAAKEYVDYSLFDALGFRVMEINNRQHLQSMLAAAKIDASATSLAVSENELSLLAGAPETVDDKAEADGHAFSIGGSRLATWSNSGAKVAAGDAALFARFLRYAQVGHPQLLDKLAKGGVIPDHLSFNLSVDRSLILTISEVRTARPPAYDLKGLKREMSSGGIDALLDRIAAMTPEQLAALRTAHACDTASDFSDAQILDTVLGRIECTLSTGKPLSFTPEQKQAVGAAPALGLMFAAIHPSSEAEYEGAVKTLVALRQQAPRKAYVLKLFEANNRVHLKQTRQTREDIKQLFTEVLEANPMLAGAYKDLGDLLMMEYDSARAWRCWDSGRRLAPGLPNFEPVNQFEAGMLAQHPEYF